MPQAHTVEIAGGDIQVNPDSKVSPPTLLASLSGKLVRAFAAAGAKSVDAQNA
jgi:hypothetical protein